MSPGTDFLKTRFGKRLDYVLRKRDLGSIVTIILFSGVGGGWLTYMTS